MSAGLRGAIYNVAACVLALAGIYGLVTAAESEHWLNLVQALITFTGMAVSVLARRYLTPDDPPARHAEPDHVTD